LLVNRKAHRLKDNKTSPFPRNLIFFDVESKLVEDGEKTLHLPYLICAISYYQDGKGNVFEEEKHFTDTVPFWDWVIAHNRKKEALYLFAHNPTYDVVSSKGIPCLVQKGYHLTSFYNKGRTFILSFRNDQDKKSIHILNVGNFFPGTVKQIGESFGLPKLEMDYENPTIEQALPYCKRDVEIIKTAMLSWFAFCKQNDLGSFGKTFPKQAINCYRHRFMKNPIYIHNHQEACNLERECYYGGRTESFVINQTPIPKVYYLDVNSMYPYVMKEFLYPNKLITYRENLTLYGLKYILNNRAACAKVKLKTDQKAFPCRIAGRLIFPVGEFITSLCTEELKLAFEYGAIQEVLTAAIYELQDLFSDFIDFFYHARMEAREKGNKVEDLFFKLFMNSLYGKFGQKSGEWEIIGKTKEEGAGYIEYYDNVEGKYYTAKYIAGTLMVKKDEKEAYDSFPAIAAHITTNSRVILWNYMQLAGIDNVFYTDTDSLMVNETGYLNLQAYESKNELGKLKLEKVLENLIVNAPKDYEHKAGIARKGVPKDAKQLSPNTFLYTQWPKLSTLIRKNSIDQYFTFWQEKQLKRQYLKGWVTSTGEVKPFEITVKDNQNIILPWQQTSCFKQGYQLANPEQINWVSKAFKGHYLPYD